LTNSRVTCCGTAIGSLAMTSENVSHLFMGICDALSAPRSPWQRAYVERVIGSIQRECLDHVIVFNENSLRRTLNSYFDYYHRSRTHLSLGKNSPEPRAIQPPEMGAVVGYCRSVGCITATNDGLPDKPESTRLRAVSPRGFEIRVRTVLTCTRVNRRISFARLRQGRDQLTLFASPRGMASEAGRTEFSLGTIVATGASQQEPVCNNTRGTAALCAAQH
jgi:hypothetical protein